MKDLRQLLKKKNVGAREPLDEKSVFFVFSKVIRDEYGKQGAENIQPRFLKNRKIFVTAHSSTWASEIWLNRANIVSKINEEIGSEEISDIAVD